MTVASSAAPGAHTVQFYEDERFLHRAVVAFFARGLESGEPLVVIARHTTFEAIATLLAEERKWPVAEAVSRIQYFEVGAALSDVMDGAMPDPVRCEKSFSDLLADLSGKTDGTAWIFGEMSDVLYRQGNRAGAVQLETLWNGLAAGYPVSTLCGYAIQDFDGDVDSVDLRNICRQHTHIIPAEGFSEAPDDRTRLEEVALLQQRARTRGRATPYEPAVRVQGHATAASTVYIIDDDTSVRRSLARLLASIDLHVRTFESAEAFLEEVDETSNGCLIVDVQLVGMSGPDLQGRMAGAKWQMPIIAMSGSYDTQIEKEALRLGARAFLRKPFEAQALIDAITRALA